VEDILNKVERRRLDLKRRGMGNGRVRHSRHVLSTQTTGLDAAHNSSRRQSTPNTGCQIMAAARGDERPLQNLIKRPEIASRARLNREPDCV
jgi:hypothetical protein